MNLKSLNNFEFFGKRVLLRCDFNVPVNEKAEVLEDFKIRLTLPTIKYLLEKKAKIILITHLDPENQGVVDKKFTVNNIAQKLSDFLEIEIKKTDQVIGPEAENYSNSLKEGEILMLENIRFHPEETKGDLSFAKKLSYLGDCYINDAFAVCHRSHASVALLPQLLPHCPGFLLEKEISALDKIMKNPERPFVAIVGGRKIETKAKFIESILKMADKVIISGLIKKELIDKKMNLSEEKLISPLAGEDLKALDISEKTAELFREQILKAKTIIWNGPFGKFEDEKYKKGTLTIANAIIESGAYSVAGGGQTVEFLNKEGLASKFSHVSTGGGAMLSYIAGEKLPGIEALK